MDSGAKETSHFTVQVMVLKDFIGFDGPKAGGEYVSTSRRREKISKKS